MATSLFIQYADRSPFTLSGGEKRRVALAGVLATSPSILVLDEPAAGLDPSGASELDTILLDLNRSGVTIVRRHTTSAERPP